MNKNLNAIIENMRNQNTREPVIVQAMYKQDLFDEIASGRKALKRARRFTAIAALTAFTAVAALGVSIVTAAERGAVPGCILAKSEMTRSEIKALNIAKATVEKRHVSK